MVIVSAVIVGQEAKRGMASSLNQLAMPEKLGAG